MLVLLFILGIGLLIGGAELLVRGATRLALGFGISPLVIGLTVVAFGTSAPELAVTIQSSLAGQSDLAIGNVVGSNITNILLILGLAATITPLSVSQKLIRLDVPIMVAASVIMLLLSLDGAIGQLDGALLVVGIVGYTTFAIVQSRRESRHIQREYAAEYGDADAKYPTAAERLRDVALVVIGLIMLTFGARWIVDGAVAFARALGISELVIGLTIIAIGTSLPEIAATVVASLRGERDIAVGNVVGSCIFNIFSVLGLAAVVAPGGITVAETVRWFDIPVMIAVSFACLPFFIHGGVLYRWEGLLFLSYYVAYTIYLVLTATRSVLLGGFTTAMIGFVLPLTLLTVMVVLVRIVRNRHTTIAVPK
jgi:cation:H+ antiporter